MAKQRSIPISLLVDIVEAIRKMPDDRFAQLLRGELRVAISFRKVSVAKLEFNRPLAKHLEFDFTEIQAELTRAESREEGMSIIDRHFENRASMFAFAKHLDLPIQSKDRMERIREKIITNTVGRRLGGKAIRGDIDGA